MKTPPTNRQPLSLVVVGIVAAVVIGIGLIAAQPVSAQTSGPSLGDPSSVPAVLASAPDVRPTNYCVGCHSPEDSRLATATEWIGSIEREAISPCPALTQVHTEVYYTERALLGFERAADAAGNQPAVAKARSRVDGLRETYSRMLDVPVTSVDAFTSEAQQLRYTLAKSYSAAHTAIDASKERWVLIVAGLVTLALLLSLLWGLRHTQRFARSAFGRALRPRWSALILVLLVLAFFSLPIFRTFPAEVAGSSEEEMERLAAVDTAERVADVADRAGARAWALARVGSRFYGADPDAGRQALTDAVAALSAVRLDSTALWGEAQQVQEATLGSLPLQEQAGAAADRLTAARSRAWPAVLMAREWVGIDPDRARELLGMALEIAEANSTSYRDLDLRSIAVAWATLDPARARSVADSVADPALRSWGLREIAEITGDVTLYPAAADAARAVSDPAQRARSLREVASSSGQAGLFDEASQALSGTEGAARAYALSDLAAASGNPTHAVQIEPAYAAAQAAAWLRLGQYEQAWEAAGRITDAMERSRAQSSIAARSGRVDLAGQISDPTLRDRAVRDITITTNDVVKAARIESVYYRVQALTGLRQFGQAQVAAASLTDGYPLRTLAAEIGEFDRQAALTMVDLMDREADKALALRSVAGEGDDDLFQRALGMALAARVRGDSLAPVEAALALARSVDGTRAPAALVQAYETASRIVVKYK